MKYNPFVVPKGTMIWEFYGDLARRTTLSEIEDEMFVGQDGKAKVQGAIIPSLEDLDLMVRFTLLFVVNKNNPISEYRNFDDREAVTWEALGVKTDKNASPVVKFVRQRHVWFRQVMLEIFKIINEDFYEEWFSLKMEFHTRASFLRQQISFEDQSSDITVRDKIAAGMTELRKRIKNLEYTLFNNEESVEIITKEATANKLYAELYAMDYQPVRVL